MMPNSDPRDNFLPFTPRTHERYLFSYRHFRHYAMAESTETLTREEATENALRQRFSHIMNGVGILHFLLFSLISMSHCRNLFQTTNFSN